MRTFRTLLANNLIAVVTNNFVWFALIFWAYLTTKSVIATSVLGGLFLVATAGCGIWFGFLVDHHRKKDAMVLSSIASLVCYTAGLLLYLLFPGPSFERLQSPQFWGLVVLLLAGVIAGNIRTIAVPTCVTLLVPEDERDRANGLSGSMIGVAFSITSFASGIALAYTGMLGVMLLTLAGTLVALVHMLAIHIPEGSITHLDGSDDAHPSPPLPERRMDLRGTIAVVAAIPGLFGLIFFNMFNNFLGGVFMSLMDAYGLSMVSVQVWGILWGFISLAFVVGGLWIAKYGLGPSPLRTLFVCNLIIWTISIFFTIQPSVPLLVVGCIGYLILVPFIEAAEQTILQRVVPMERQGRVFGFAQSLEQCASPLTSFIIGPIAEHLFIPFMTTGAGVALIGGWFGTGKARGLALVFVVTGIIGLVVTILAMASRSYRRLGEAYESHAPTVKETPLLEPSGAAST